MCILVFMRITAPFFIFLFFLSGLCAAPKVATGIEVLMTPEYQHLIKNKRVGLITNQTGITGRLQSNIDWIRSQREPLNVHLTALFAPEHGINGSSHAAESIIDAKNEDIPVYSLHGKSKRPSKDMLKNIDVLIFDIQDIGSRSYTYGTTLYYVMEEAAKQSIPVIVADRPNPINGLVVDGPMLEPKWRSFLGYINVPYVHGMTFGELARYFNEEYEVGCRLTVVPMKGWKRNMTFADTDLPWIPTSPNIPEATTAYHYPMTGILGELNLVSIGIGHTLPFKVVGTPWIDPVRFAEKLNQQKLPGVYFQPFYFKPFYGTYAKKECAGVLIVVTDHLRFQPVSTQYMIIGLLKSLYPKEFKAALKKSARNKDTFNKVNGTDRPYKMIETNPYPGWSLREIDQKERKLFMKKRAKYLIPSYS